MDRRSILARIKVIRRAVREGRCQSASYFLKTLIYPNRAVTAAAVARLSTQVQNCDRRPGLRQRKRKLKH
jgi:hypothetical protein